MKAVQRGCKLCLVRRQTRGVVGRSGIVIDLIQRDAVASPAPFEFTVVIVDEHPLRIDDVNLSRVLVEVEKENAAGKDIGLLIVLGRTRSRRSRRAMAEVPKKFALRGIFLNAIAL